MLFATDRKSTRERGLSRMSWALSAAIVAGLLTAVLLVAGKDAGAQPSNFLELETSSNVRFDATGTVDWANAGPCTYNFADGGSQSCAGSGGVFNGGVFVDADTPPTSSRPHGSGRGQLLHHGR